MQPYVAAEDVTPGVQLLLREFSHRAINDWTSAISSVSLAAARCSSDEVRMALGEVEERLRSFARVQTSLRMPDHSTRMEASLYLRQLCRAISHAKLESRGIELILVDHPFSMSSERCWVLGMIVAELITNAARHAFAEGGGSIRVELRPTETSVECRVTDDGTCSPNIRPGQGLRIIESLAQALQGDVSMRFGPQGSTSTLRFPLDA